MSASASDQARALLLRESYGTLSTHSRKFPGFPFGSLVTYTLDRKGAPVMQLSDLAQHTRNLEADPRASLMLQELQEEDVQASARLTILGTVVRISAAEAEDSGARYFRRFPDASGYQEVHEFAFYRMEVVALRFIGGFGAIHWLEAPEVLPQNPFDAETEAGIVEHMNEDHVSSLRHYCQHFKQLEVPEAVSPVMTSIDAEGFEVRLGQRLHRFLTDQLMQNAQDARKALVRMAYAGRNTTPGAGQLR